ncbi:MAG: TetR family transcriptional regulator [Rudaea sp.]|nr:TetR family transcriptional regulator [Rudaea sp.]
MIGRQVNSVGTKARLLQAAETLFVEYGYEAMSMRQITAQAEANLAAVNYYFGTKEALLKELLSSRLDRLNEERRSLLAACERVYGENGMDVSLVLAVLFVPALRLARDDGPLSMRLLGRIYSDPSPFIRDYLGAHYREVYECFFAAFERALPQVPRHELGVRLQFSLKALSGVLASQNLDQLIAALCVGEEVTDTRLLARLIAIVSPMLTTPFGQSAHADAIERVMALADDAGLVPALSPTKFGSTGSVFDLLAQPVAAQGRT